MDDMDRMQEREDILLARAIEARRAPATTGALFCEDCEEPIPEPRRRALPSATRCIHCQSAQEARNA